MPSPEKEMTEKLLTIEEILDKMIPPPKFKRNHKELEDFRKKKTRERRKAERKEIGKTPRIKTGDSVTRRKKNTTPELVRATEMKLY